MKTNSELKELKSKSINELNKELMESKKKLFELQKNLSLDKLKKTSEIRDLKKKIARIKTIIYLKLEEELVSETASNKSKDK